MIYLLQSEVFNIYKKLEMMHREDIALRTTAFNQMKTEVEMSVEGQLCLRSHQISALCPKNLYGIRIFETFLKE